MNKEYEKIFTERGFTNIEQMSTMFDYYKNELERYENIIERVQSIYTSMQFSAPENMYVFIDQLGDALEELKGE